MRLPKAVEELLFPPKCILCRDLLSPGEQDLCGQCSVNQCEFTTAMPKIAFVSKKCALWRYEGYARSSILRYKFWNKRHYAAGYARLLGAKLRKELHGEYDLITWVPISNLRRLKRGFDQVELLATTLGKELGCEPVCCLKKIRHNRPQSGIRDDAKRKANVLNAYRAEQPENFAGKRILLLDDIITTGATVSECARVLLTAGAKEVHAAAVAAARNHK